MDILGGIFEVCLDVMRISFDIWGFTLSLWQVFVFVLVIDVVAWVVWEVILGG